MGRSIGTIFYKLNIDQVPDFEDVIGSEHSGPNSFYILYGRDENGDPIDHWGHGKIDSGSGNNSWTDFEATIQQVSSLVDYDFEADEDWGFQPVRGWASAMEAIVEPVS